MEEDRKRWNKKYSEGNYLTEVNKAVVEYSKLAKGKNALDIAAGMGRNSKYLVEHGFSVDAVELSDVAVENLKRIKGLNVIQADLDNYILEPDKYDLIICINYLNRQLFPLIKNALRPAGILIYETLMRGEETDKLHRNPLFLVKPGELREAFNTLKVLKYNEYIDYNKNNQSINKALLVAKKNI